MKLHANARLSVKGRELLVDRVLVVGWSLTQAAEAAGVSERTAAKWVARFREEGPAGLADRSSVPGEPADPHARGSPSSNRGASPGAPERVADRDGGGN